MPKKVITSLRQKCPEAAEMWANDLNEDGLTPDTVGAGSDKLAYFRCLRNPAHVFQKRISKMTSSRDGHSVGCIYCGPNAKVAFPGETDLMTVIPETQAMWDFEKNTSIDPRSLLPKSQKKAYFKCPQGHHVLRKISDFTKSPHCPACRDRSFRIGTVTPNISEFLRKEKTPGFDPQEEPTHSGKRAFFKCPKCDYEWSRTLVKWCAAAFCPCCGYDGSPDGQAKHAAVIAKNNIQTLKMAFPDIEKYWDYSKNGEETPNSVTAKSGKKAWLLCDKGHSFKRIISSLNRSKLVSCPICTNRRSQTILGINDLFTVCPEAKFMWDYERNQDLDPKHLAGTAHVRAYFKCRMGHQFSKMVGNFKRDPTCPECRYTENYSIFKTRPDMLKFWDYSKMTHDPKTISPTSLETGFWQCPDCSYQWQQAFSSLRLKSDTMTCPFCAGNPENCNSFKKYNPEAAKLWLPDNQILPSLVTPMSTKTIRMQCPNNSEHVFNIQIQRIPLKPPFGCPICSTGSQVKAIKGVTDLFTQNPQAKVMWDWQRNQKIDPYELRAHARIKAFFVCPEGHHFAKKIADFARSSRCPICAFENRMYIDGYPHLLKQWDFGKNREIDIHTTLAMSQQLAWWRCPQCGYEWQSQIKSRRDSKGLCPCCEVQVVQVPDKNDLFTLIPELRVFFDFEKNDGLELKNIFFSSQKPVWWRCPECEYSWQTKPTARQKKVAGKYQPKGCPICGFVPGQITAKPQTAPRVIWGELYPELVPKFLSQLNGCSLTDVNNLASSTQKYWWQCTLCHHRFETTIGSMVRARDSASMGCSYCSGKKVLRSQSFAVLHPEVMDEYDPENTVDPYTVTEKSSLMVNWICRNNPEHRWQAPFGKRAAGIGACSLCRGYHYGRMLAEESPELKQYFDVEKNKRDFDTYTNESNELVWWHCEHGHSFQNQPYRYSNRDFYCPFCEGYRIETGINTIADVKPKLVVEWSTYNERPMSEYFAFSTHSVLWHCDDCGGDYPARLCDREEDDHYCPYCDNRKALVGFNTIVDYEPELASEWSSRNERGISNYVYTSTMRAYWICPTCQHSYTYPICERQLGDESCPYCNNRLPMEGMNTLPDIHPELIPEWSVKNELPPAHYLATSSLRTQWHCSTCGNDYFYPICERQLNDDSCPYCNNRLAKLGFNTVVDIKPELMIEWSKNNERPASEFMYSSPYWAIWQCSICHGEYTAPIRRRELHDDACPYCRDRKPLLGLNTLIDKNPDLAKEWSPRNEDNIADFTYISSWRVWWTCPTCHGDYQAVIRDRQVGDNACPYCRNVKVLPGFNSFADNHPDLMTQWDSVANMFLVNSKQILDSCAIKVWWICEDNPSHHYQLSPQKLLYYRKRHMKSCPYCKGYRRKRRHFV